jgi:sugar transferase EpsL
MQGMYSYADSIYKRVGKRMLDLTLVIASMPITLPLICAVSVAIRIGLGSPVFFRQERLGLNGKEFLITKFRTMSQARDQKGDLLSDQLRLTRLGRWLRSTSVDELPELINVLRGEMSLVGPRPLHSYYRDRYSDRQFRRHHAPPGITGWAQVHGRNAISWEKKFELDLWYVQHQSLWLDLKILCLTSLNLFRSEGVTQPGHATADEFKGTFDKGV